MKGNFHVQFLGEGVAATSPPYPTPRGAIPWGHPARNCLELPVPGTAEDARRHPRPPIFPSRKCVVKDSKTHFGAERPGRPECLPTPARTDPHAFLACVSGGSEHTNRLPQPLDLGRVRQLDIRLIPRIPADRLPARHSGDGVH